MLVDVAKEGAIIMIYIHTMTYAYGVQLNFILKGDTSMSVLALGLTNDDDFSVTGNLANVL